MPPHDSNSKRGHPDVVGWVLGALDPVNAKRFAEHAPSCATCQANVSELEPLARLFRDSVTEVKPTAVKPPVDLRRRTLARVEWAARLADAEPALTSLGDRTGPRTPGAREQVTVTPRQIVPERKNAELDSRVTRAQSGLTMRISGRRRASVRALSLGVAAAVAIGIGVTVWVSRPASANLAFTIPLHAAHGGTASGQAYANHAQTGWSIQLTVRGLRDVGPNRFYECWYVGPGNRPGHPDLIAAGTFTIGRSGSATMRMWSAADPRHFPTMQIASEQPGGTGQDSHVILSGSISAR